VGQRSEHRITFVVDLAGKHGIDDRRRAGERHHGRLDADGRVEEKATYVGHGADTRVSHVELALVGLGVSSKLLEVVGPDVLAHHEQFGVFGDQPDGLEIPLRVVPRLG
jgi:hypothetical protein